MRKINRLEFSLMTGEVQKKRRNSSHKKQSFPRFHVGGPSLFIAISGRTNETENIYLVPDRHLLCQNEMWFRTFTRSISLLVFVLILGLS
ncbi:hypothetical protein CDAR_119111 [Caerostris darwini]|uniref:Uncharacterized protein n=1 Tax=Caerostris darwini TaxID=1538125 RepID=A0AAV4VCL1_9ARAC|nr:hypothetical protein CDAR_119111 [Caerostris darwini]